MKLNQEIPHSPDAHNPVPKRRIGKLRVVIKFYGAAFSGHC